MFLSKTGWQVQVVSKLPSVLPQVNCEQMSDVQFERFTWCDMNSMRSCVVLVILLCLDICRMCYGKS